MTTPNVGVVADRSTPEVAEVSDTGTDDALVAELDALDDPERASEHFLGEPAASDSPADTPAATPTESPSDPAAVPADSTTPDPFTDLLKDATPLTYTVDRQDRAFDGIVLTKSGHGVVPPDQVDRLRNTLGLAEKSIADNKVLYERTRRFDQLGGEQRLAEQAATIAQLDAAGTQLLAILQDPTALLMLDAEGNVVKNPKAISDLTEKLQSVSRIAEYEAKEKFQQAFQQTQQVQHDATTQGRALDAVVAQFQQQYPDLTPQDLAAAKAHFGPFASALFRQATPEDAQRYGYRIGEWLIDTPKMVPYFEDRAASRRDQATAAKARQAAEAENRKRQTVVSPPKPKAAPQPRRDDGTFAQKNKDSQEERERVRTAINRAHRKGEFYVDSTTERDV